MFFFIITLTESLTRDKQHIIEIGSFLVALSDLETRRLDVFICRNLNSDESLWAFGISFLVCVLLAISANPFPNVSSIFQTRENRQA